MTPRTPHIIDPVTFKHRYTLRRSIGTAIRDAREEFGQSIGELAAELGISSSSLHHIETGNSTATRAVERAMDWLGVSLEEGVNTNA